MNISRVILPWRSASNWPRVLLSLLLLCGTLGCGVSAGTMPSPQPRTTSGTPIVPRSPTPGVRFTAAPQPTPTVRQPTTQLTRTPVSSPDFVALQHLMLDLVNADRRKASLGAVAWDDFAAQVGMAHALEMADNGYMSHWNLQGYGPDVRYSLAGGVDAVMENVYRYWYRYNDGRPAPIQDWQKVIREAQASLMNSPGHRANILDPDHTHLGIGIAYNAQTGDVRIAQEFINRYVTLDPLPRQMRVGDKLEVRGMLLPGAAEPLINLAYEPFPQPLTVGDLENKKPGTYTSPADIFQPLNPNVSGDHFTASVMLDHNRQPGLYHIRVWVKTKGRDVAASDVVIAVQ